MVGSHIGISSSAATFFSTKNIKYHKKKTIPDGRNHQYIWEWRYSIHCHIRFFLNIFHVRHWLYVLFSSHKMVLIKSTAKKKQKWRLYISMPEESLLFYLKIHRICITLYQLMNRESHEKKSVNIARVPFLIWPLIMVMVNRIQQLTVWWKVFSHLKDERNNDDTSSSFFWTFY